MKDPVVLPNPVQPLLTQTQLIHQLFLEIDLPSKDSLSVKEG